MKELDIFTTISVGFLVILIAGVIIAGSFETDIPTGEHTDYEILNIFASEGYFTVFYIENNTTKNVEVGFDRLHLNETNDYMSIVQYRHHFPLWGIIDIQGNTTVAELYLTTETFQKLDGLGGK